MLGARSACVGLWWRSSAYWCNQHCFAGWYVQHYSVSYASRQCCQRAVGKNTGYCRILPFCGGSGHPLRSDKRTRHAGHRSDGVSGPLPPALEPLNTIRAAAEFRKDTSIKIATLVGAPADKTGTPFYMFRKSVPAPIGFPSYIAKLRSGNLYNQLGVIRVIENLPQRVVAQHMENPGSVPAKQDRSLATRCRR